MQFKCWKCQAVLRELMGEAHAVLDQVRCAGCGELNAISYAFPLAPAEIVEIGGPSVEEPSVEEGLAEPTPEKRKGKSTSAGQ